MNTSRTTQKIHRALYALVLAVVAVCGPADAGSPEDARTQWLPKGAHKWMGKGPSVVRWSKKTGNVVSMHQRIQFESGRRTTSIRFSKDGKWIATRIRESRKGKDRFAIQIWSAASGKVLHTIKLESKAGRHSPFRFSPDSRFLGIAEYRTVKLWSLKKAKVVRVVPTPHFNTTRIRDLTFTSNGHLRTVSDGFLHHWRSGEFRRTIELEKAPDSGDYRMSPDGKFVAEQDVDRIRIWSVATGKLSIQTEKNPSTEDADCTFFAYSRDGRKIITGASNGIVSIWEAHTGVLERSFLNSKSIISAAITPDGKTVVVSQKGMLLFRAMDSGALRGRWKTGAFETHCLVLTADGKRVLTGTQMKSVPLIIWNVPKSSVYLVKK